MSSHIDCRLTRTLLLLSSCCVEAQRAAANKRRKSGSGSLRRVLVQRMACPAHEHELKTPLSKHK